MQFFSKISLLLITIFLHQNSLSAQHVSCRQTFMKRPSKIKLVKQTKKRLISYYEQEASDNLVERFRNTPNSIHKLGLESVVLIDQSSRVTRTGFYAEKNLIISTGHDIKQGELVVIMNEIPSSSGKVTRRAFYGLVLHIDRKRDVSVIYSSTSLQPIKLTKNPPIPPAGERVYSINHFSESGILPSEGKMLKTYKNRIDSDVLGCSGNCGAPLLSKDLNVLGMVNGHIYNWNHYKQFSKEYVFSTTAIRTHILKEILAVARKKKNLDFVDFFKLYKQLEIAELDKVVESFGLFGHVVFLK